MAQRTQSQPSTTRRRPSEFGLRTSFGFRAIRISDFPWSFRGPLLTALAALVCLLGFGSRAAVTLFETTSPYHHIRVIDDAGMRTLYFDDAAQTAMSLRDPLSGQFEYTDYFHTPWLWNTNIASVLIVGLGGASTQRSFEHYYPTVKIDTVEIDPAVVRAAGDYFAYKESPRQKVHVEDGRLFLRRGTGRYDLIILDAYVQGRYGSSIPQHLATKEFFELTRDHLTTNGVVAYNVIGTLASWRAEIVGALYHTLQSVFPQIYVFPARTSLNVVLVATRESHRADLTALRERALLLMDSRRVTFPGFMFRLERLQLAPPSNASRSPVLTDDYAPVEGLASAAGRN